MTQAQLEQGLMVFTTEALAHPLSNEEMDEARKLMDKLRDELSKIDKSCRILTRRKEVTPETVK